MQTVISLIVLIAMGILCAFIHKNKGYSPIAGFCLGFFFFIIGLIIVLVERNLFTLMNLAWKYVGIYYKIDAFLNLKQSILNNRVKIKIL